MKTPIADFVRAYEKSKTVRLHMPGHKGHSFLGCEPLDITEISGADELSTAEGIIGESERNASALFGTAKTLFSTEGSSQCIRAMIYLATMHRRTKERPLILAARNSHKAFIYALALSDADVVWLWPKKTDSLCSCPITAKQVENALQAAPRLPDAVYVTSPDYLGVQLPIREIAEVCHKYGTLLLVDNAHGAYLHFLPIKQHPMDLGADMCCDSAHKTLPVLTGGAYLHISHNAPDSLAKSAKNAMSVFGSTSPSYLILASLDICNAYLDANFREKLKKQTELTEQIKNRLRENGWNVASTEPMKITIHCSGGSSGISLAKRLREQHMECEYADADNLVMMVSAETTREDLEKLACAMGKNTFPNSEPVSLPPVKANAAMTVRDAVFSPEETVRTEQAVGRICAAPTVSCPPAIPIVVSGEIIDQNAAGLLSYYGINTVSVVKTEEAGGSEGCDRENF